MRSHPLMDLGSDVVTATSNVQVFSVKYRGPGERGRLTTLSGPLDSGWFYWATATFKLADDAVDSVMLAHVAGVV